jgi:hypothetical protein
MVWRAIMGAITKGGPTLLKQLPKLWPLLLETKNRQAILLAARDLASFTPDKRMRGAVDGTLAVAQGLAADATDESERAKADVWVRRAKDLGRQLDLPVVGRGARGQRRASVARQLMALQGEINVHLGHEEPPD